MAESFFRTFTRDDGETEVTVEIEVSSWGSPGGYWEPPEGRECEIVSARLTEGGEDVKLTEKEAERMELAFLEDPPEPDYGPDE